MKLILSGYMGSGKTAVGKALAGMRDLPFLDLDNEISKIEEQSIPEIFSDKGEIYFRKKETLVLRNLLEQEEDYVLALGGGTPCYGKNLQLIKEAPDAMVIYLKVSLSELKSRLLEEKEQRPLIRHLESSEVLEDFIRKHLFERAFYYNQSDLIISAEAKAPEDIAAEIINRLS